METMDDIFKREGLTWKDFPLLIIDDEKLFLEDIKSNLADEFKIITTTKISDVPKLITENKIAVIASDQRMPDKTGTEVLANVKKEFPNIIRLLITGYTDYDAAVDAINKGEIYRYIPKNSRMEEKIATLKQAIEIFFHREYERKTRELDKALILNKPQPSK